MQLKYYTASTLFDMMHLLGPNIWGSRDEREIPDTVLYDILCRHANQVINPATSNVYNFIVDVMVKRGLSVPSPTTRLKRVYLSHIPSEDYIKWITSYPQNKSLIINIGGDFTMTRRQEVFRVSNVYKVIEKDSTNVEIPFHKLSKQTHIWTRVSLSIPQDPGDVVFNSQLPEVQKSLLDEIQVRGYKHLHQLNKDWDEASWDGIELTTYQIPEKRRGIFLGKAMTYERSMRTRDATVIKTIKKSSLKEGMLINMQDYSNNKILSSLHKLVGIKMSVAPDSRLELYTYCVTPLNEAERWYSVYNRLMKTSYTTVRSIKVLCELNKE